MNLAKIHKLVQKDWSFTFNVDVVNKEKIQFSADIVSDSFYGKDCSVKAIVYSEGTFHVFFSFGKIDYDFETLVLINKFNNNIPFLWSYINENNGGSYFELHSCGLYGSNEKAIASSISSIIADVVDDYTLSFLQPILKKTY